MCHRYVCRLIEKLTTGHQQLKDAARKGRPATSTTNYIEKGPHHHIKDSKNYDQAISYSDRLVGSTSSLYKAHNAQTNICSVVPPVGGPKNKSEPIKNG